MESNKPSVSNNQPETQNGTSKVSNEDDIPQISPHSSQYSKKQIATTKSIRRKFQVSNGYLLEFDQLARILHFLLEHIDAKKISRKVLLEDTGMADRQVESLVSMGAAMGLITPGRQVLTPVGLLIAEQDIFIEKRGSLEWCHYVAAGSFRNLVWFEIFNCLLTEASPMTIEEWSERVRIGFSDKYSKRTISKGFNEIRFVIDAYMERNFSKLELLRRSSDQRLYRRRYIRFAPLVLTAIIYDFCATRETHLSQIDEMAVTPGSPAVVFGLDATCSDSKSKHFTTVAGCGTKPPTIWIKSVSNRAFPRSGFLLRILRTVSRAKIPNHHLEAFFNERYCQHGSTGERLALPSTWKSLYCPHL